MPHKLNSGIAVIGIDIGKNSFHVVGHDKRGAIVLRQKWSRGQVETRLANLRPCLIGMEACVGAEGFDVAIRVRFPPLEPTDLVMRRLDESTQCLVASPALIPHRPRLITDDMAVLREATLAGVGVVQLPSVMIWEDIRARHLVHILPQWQPRGGIVRAVFPSRT